MKKMFITLSFLMLCSVALFSEEEPNNNFISANELVLNGNNTGYIIFSTDSVDIWKITLNDDGKLVVRTTSESTVTLLLKLYDQDTTTILATDYCTYGPLYPTAKTVEFSHLKNGTYYVKVYITSGYGNYNILNVFTPPVYSNDTEPNDIPDNAETFLMGDTLYGHIGYYSLGVTDTIDWFVINTTFDGKLCIRTQSENTGEILPYIYSGDQTTLLATGYYTYGTLYPEYKTVEVNNLQAGKYYIKVKRISNYCSYKIWNIFITPMYSNDTEPNDIPDNAETFLVGDTLYGHIGYYSLGVTDTVDWFVINTTFDGKLCIRTQSENTGEILPYIYSGDQTTLLATGYYTYGTLYPEYKTVEINNLPAGKYYIKVKRVSYYCSYMIWNVFTPLPVPKFDYNKSVLSVNFNNKSLFATSYYWNFGDGTNSNLVNPSHQYNHPGVYNVTLTAINSLGQRNFDTIVEIKGIYKIEANIAGNTGDATIRIYGGGFNSNTTFRLTKEGEEDIIGNTYTYSPAGFIQTTFDLRNKTLGKWNVVVEIPGDTTMILEEGFTIVEGIKPELWVSISGRERIVFNRWQTYTINYGNKGNIDAKGVPLFIIVSREQGTELDVSNFNMGIPPSFQNDSLWQLVEDSVPLYIDIDTLNGLPFKGRVYPILLPVIPAGKSESVQVSLKTNTDVKLIAWINNPYYFSPMDDESIACYERATYKAIIDLYLDVALNLLFQAVPFADCMKTIIQSLYDAALEDKTYVNIGWCLARAALACAGDFFPAWKAYKIAHKIVEEAWKIYGHINTVIQCEKFSQNNSTNKNIIAVSSLDPNEKVGPYGYTNENYIAGNITCPYTIFFENKDTATAPVQELNIYDTLNCNFYDFTTFRFTAFGFGDTIINPIGNFKELSQDIFLNSINLIVRVTATFDEQTGIIKWNFTSLEPNNMNFPDDPMRGFLPPNINSPEGEGFVSFYVNLKSLNHDDTIKNNATIIFDANEPVITNTYTNKIDIIIPESNMLPLNSTTSDTIISLSWTGNDIGSGIKFFSVYVSINDSDYVPIIQNTSLTETIYKVEHGKNYKFYSIAIDSVNNIEDIPQTYDTQITVDTLNIFNTIFELSNIYIYPNPVKDELNISFTIPNSQNITIKLFNILSKEVKILSDNIYPKGKYNLTFNISNINSGIYFISVISNNTTITKKLFIYK